MKPKDLVGRILKTDIGNLKVSSAKYSGIKTDNEKNIIKIVTVKCQCGAVFDTTMESVENAIV